MTVTSKCRHVRGTERVVSRAAKREVRRAPDVKLAADGHLIQPRFNGGNDLVAIAPRKGQDHRIWFEWDAVRPGGGNGQGQGLSRDDGAFARRYPIWTPLAQQAHPFCSVGFVKGVGASASESGDELPLIQQFHCSEGCPDLPNNWCRSERGRSAGLSRMRSHMPRRPRCAGPEPRRLRDSCRVARRSAVRSRPEPIPCSRASPTGPIPAPSTAMGAGPWVGCTPATGAHHEDAQRRHAGRR